MGRDWTSYSSCNVDTSEFHSSAEGDSLYVSRVWKVPCLLPSVLWVEVPPLFLDITLSFGISLHDSHVCSSPLCGLYSIYPTLMCHHFLPEP